MQQLLAKYHQSFGRNGHLEETFVTSDVELRALKIIGTVYRGEILGKHSEVYSRLDDSTLLIVCDDQEWIAKGITLKVLNGSSILSSHLEDIGDRGTEEEMWTKLRNGGMSSDDIDYLRSEWGFEHD